MLAHLEGVAWKHREHQVESGLALDGIHLILEDAGQAPVFGGFGGHLYLAGDAVGDVTQELDEFRVGVLVAKVLGNKLS